MKNQNIYQEIQEKKDFLALYQEANEAFEPVPYAVEKRVIYNIAKNFSNVYHAFSFGTALISMFLLASIFSSFDITQIFSQKFNFHTIFLLCLFVFCAAIMTYLLFSLEWAKKHYSDFIFKNIAEKIKNKSQEIFYLLALSLVSIITSVLGGAALTHISADKTHLITQNYKQNSDSLHHFFEKKIAPIEQSIVRLESLQNVEIRRWGLTSEEMQQLNTLKKEKTELNTQKNMQLNHLNKKNNQTLSNNDLWAGIYMLIAGIVILFLELLNLYAYKIKFSYLARVKLEGKTLDLLEEKETKKTAGFSPTPLANLYNQTKTAGVQTHNNVQSVQNERTFEQMNENERTYEQKNEQMNENERTFQQKNQNERTFQRKMNENEQKNEQVNENEHLGFNYKHTKEVNNSVHIVNMNNLNVDDARKIREQLLKEKWKCTENELLNAYKINKIKSVSEGQTMSNMSRGKVANIRKKALMLNVS